jgi:exosome complex RNA-binding protein Csl4
MRAATRFLAIVFLAAVAFAGCHELGHIDGIGDYGGGGGGAVGRDVVGEIEYLDPRAKEIEVRTDSGRTAVLRYDDKTQVVYRQRNYSPSNLERGDYVAARVQQDRDGRSYADTITVRESVQDRGDRRSGGSRLDRVEGRVEYIDARRGTFELRDSRNRLIVVSVPFNAPRQVIDRFNRLREGDNISIEGRSTGNDRFELENFV